MLQVSAADKAEEEQLVEDPNVPEESTFTPGLLLGHFDQEQSDRSFQEALRQWRRDRRPGALEHTHQAATWTPVPAGKWRPSRPACQ